MWKELRRNAVLVMPNLRHNKTDRLWWLAGPLFWALATIVAARRHGLRIYNNVSFSTAHHLKPCKQRQLESPFVPGSENERSIVTQDLPQLPDRQFLPIRLFPRKANHVSVFLHAV